MATHTEIQNLMKDAMKAGDKVKTNTYRLLASALKQIVVDERREVTEEDVLTIVQRQVKQRKDSIAQYRAGNRADLADKEEAELAILEALMPAKMSEADTEAAIRAIVAEKSLAGPAGVGAVMKEFMARHKGKADGKAVQELARRVLGA